MYIRIIQAGYEGMNGQLGVFDFVDGVSVQDIPYLAVMQLTALMSVVDEATGDHPSNSPFEVAPVNAASPVEHRAEVAAEVSAPVAPVVVSLHTKESLEAVADASGIKGIREIADPMGLKDNSIVELIAKILAAQAAAQAAAEAEAQVVADAAAMAVLAAAASADPVEFVAK